MRTLRVGMVGHGFMGKVHGHSYRSLGFYYDPPPANIVLAGVATQTESSWQRAVARWGYEFGTSDFHALCARDDIDIIDCCAPNYAHKEILLTALEHGKHVYMDKPLCVSLAEARKMAACAAAHPKCITQMTFNYRFMPALLRAKELMDSGALGRLYSARFCYLHAGYVSPDRPFTWRLDATKSGPSGALFDLGSHVIDLALHLLGDFNEVNSLTHTFIKERPLKKESGPVFPTPAPNSGLAVGLKGAGVGNTDPLVPVNVDDIALFLFKMKNGAVGTFEASRMAMGVQDEIRVEIHGSQGAIRFNLMQPNYLEFYDGTLPETTYGGDRGFKHIECVARYPKPASLPGPKNTIGWERFHVHSIFNFISHVIEGTPAKPDILDGAKTQAVMEAVLESSRQGKWVAVPEI